MGEHMKKIMILAAALIILGLLTACAGSTVPTELQPAVTEAPTDAPYIDTQLDEPEWTLTDRELFIQTPSAVVASGEDILYFAIVSKPDGQQELLFRLSDEAAKILSASVTELYTVTLDSPDGAKIGDATMNSDCTVATITAEHANGEITALATQIRNIME